MTQSAVHGSSGAGWTFFPCSTSASGAGFEARRLAEDLAAEFGVSRERIRYSISRRH
jgi:hypothetical protein